MNKYRTLKADSENKESEATQLLEEIRFMRERMKELADETRLKDDLYKQLVIELITPIIWYTTYNVCAFYFEVFVYT